MKVKKILKYILFIILGFILINAVALLVMMLGVFVPPETDDGSKTEYFTVPGESTGGDSGVMVCILYRDTEFKKNLAHDLAKALNERGISVIIDGVSNRGVYPPADYDAVVLLSDVMSFSPNPGVTQYIKKHDYPANIIYFVTYERFFIPHGLQLDKKRIDAISSASRPGDRTLLEQARTRLLKEIMDIITLATPAT